MSRVISECFVITPVTLLQVLATVVELLKTVTAAVAGRVATVVAAVAVINVTAVSVVSKNRYFYCCNSNSREICCFSNAKVCSAVFSHIMTAPAAVVISGVAAFYEIAEPTVAAVVLI